MSPIVSGSVFMFKRCIACGKRIMPWDVFYGTHPPGDFIHDKCYWEGRNEIPA